MTTTALAEVRTARLIGRRPVEEDLPDYLRFWTDSRVPEDCWPGALRTPADAERTLRESIADWQRRGWGPWTVVEAGSGAVVGRVGLAETELDDRTRVELAWFIDPGAWGRGYATEMARAAADAGFAILGLAELIAMTTVANSASQAVMRKLGFSYVRTIDHAGLRHVVHRLGAGDLR